MVRPHTRTPTSRAAVQALVHSRVTTGPSVVTPLGRKPRDAAPEQPDSASRPRTATSPTTERRRAPRLVPGGAWRERGGESVRTAHLSDGSRGSRPRTGRSPETGSRAAARVCPPTSPNVPQGDND